MSTEPTVPAQPLISIVLPTFNGVRFLQEAIDSCLAQTWRHFELILVDDASTDPETLRILSSQTDPRVRIERQKANLGLPRALNAGFMIAQGDLLTWTSDDNRYRPEALEVLAEALAAGGADFVYARATAIDDDGREMGAIVPEPPENLVLDNCIGPCFLYTREVLEAIGPYDPAATLAEDYEYWVRVARRFRMRRVDRDLYLYRHHATTLTSVHGRGRVKQKIDEVRRRYFPAWRVLRADGLKAFARDDLEAARSLLLGSLLRRPFQTDLYRPAAIAALPACIVRLIVNLKRRFLS
ncbi:glycosyltransferase [Candidatus Sumerlaeota bacterium]|nr:glycosyltransferase [Candidatus Sumerlaeota bacterium]